MFLGSYCVVSLQLLRGKHTLNIVSDSRDAFVSSRFDPHVYHETENNQRVNNLFICDGGICYCVIVLIRIRLWLSSTFLGIWMMQKVAPMARKWEYHYQAPQAAKSACREWLLIALALRLT